MPKPVCVKCQCFYRVKQNGYYFTEMMPNGIHEGPSEERRGTRMPEAWTPYKIWVSDMYECPDCKHQILTGFSNRPLAEHYQPDFQAHYQAYGQFLIVNDC